MQKIVEICILFQLFIALTIQDIKYQKISNSLILLGICMKIIISFIFHYAIDVRNLFENTIFLILLFNGWRKKWIGGGDVKMLLLFLIYIPYFSNISLLYPVISNLNDRIEFFLSVFLLFLISYVYERVAMNQMQEKTRKKKILAPFFLSSLILALVF